MDAGERGRVAEMAVARRAVDDLTGLLRKYGCTRAAAELGDWHQRAALAAARPSSAPARAGPAGVGYVECHPTDTEDLIAGRVAYDVTVQRGITLPDGWRTRWFRRARDNEIREFTDAANLLGFTPNRGHEIWLRSGLGDQLPETVAHELDHLLRPLDVDPDVHEHLATRAGQMYRLEYRERWPLDPFESW